MKRKVSENLSYEDENKKVRTDKPCPSKVLHIRSLPGDITEMDIASLAIPFGYIAYLVVTRKTAQALIQMETKEAAESIFNYYLLNPPHIRNKRCYFQYSIHNSLQAPNTSMHPDAENAVHVSNKMHESLSKEDTGPVLRIIIDDYDHERISNLHLFKMFQYYGTLLKIVGYVNKGIFQGFIEYTDTISAEVARTQANGLCLFPRRCTMKLSFSNRKTIDISREDEMIRDYIKHPVDPHELKHIHVNNGADVRESEDSRRDIPKQRMHRNDSREDDIRMLRNPLDALAALRPLLSQAVDYPEDTMPLLRSLAPAICGLLENSHEYRDGKDSHDRHRSDDRTKYDERSSPLLIVSNLNEDKVNADALFKLFGCYGDVVRVKIMFNRKNTALIQFVSDVHAQRALHFLNGVSLYGKPISANFSKHDRISHRAPVLAEDADESELDPLHRDYTDHKLHRFKRASARANANIYEPSRVLHVAGLIEEVTEEDVEAIFQDHEFKARKVKIITPNNKKMALVEMDCVDEAVEALIALHDFDLCGSHLRVSFSKAGPLH